MSQPTAESALAALQPLLGEWTMDVVMPDGSGHDDVARTSVTWDDSGAFVVMRSVVDTADGPPNSTSIIGCDAAGGTYTQLYSDDRGVCRTYRMTIDGDGWELHRDGEPFAQRFTATFTDGGATMRGRWEKDEDGSGLTTDFDVVYRRAGGHERTAG